MPVRHPALSDQGPSPPGQLVDPGGYQTQARVDREIWTTPRALGTSPSRPGKVVEPAGPRTWARRPRDSCWTQGDIGHGPESPGTDGRPQDLGHGPKSRGSAGRSRGPSVPGPNGQRHRVDLTGPRTQARVARDCWSTPREHGPQREWPGIAGRTRGPSDTGRVARGNWWMGLAFGHGQSSPGMLVDTTESWTRS